MHPLGKSPVVTIDVPGSSPPVVLAESAAIAEYFLDHYGKETSLAPIRYQAGKDGLLGGETESWLRYRMLMVSSPQRRIALFETHVLDSSFVD